MAMTAGLEKLVHSGARAAACVKGKRPITLDAAARRLAIGACGLPCLYPAMRLEERPTRARFVMLPAHGPEDRNVSWAIDQDHEEDHEPEGQLGGA